MRRLPSGSGGSAIATCCLTPPAPRSSAVGAASARLGLHRRDIGTSPPCGLPLVRSFSSPGQQTRRSSRRTIGYTRILSQLRSRQTARPWETARQGGRPRFSSPKREKTPLPGKPVPAPCPHVTLSDTGGQEERAQSRRSGRFLLGCWILPVPYRTIVMSCYLAGG